MAYDVNNIKNYQQILDLYKRHTGDEQHDNAGMQYWDDQINSGKSMEDINRDFAGAAAQTKTQYAADPSSLAPDARAVLDNKAKYADFIAQHSQGQAPQGSAPQGLLSPDRGLPRPGQPGQVGPAPVFGGQQSPMGGQVFGGQSFGGQGQQMPGQVFGGQATPQQGEVYGRQQPMGMQRMAMQAQPAQLQGQSMNWFDQKKAQDAASMEAARSDPRYQGNNGFNESMYTNQGAGYNFDGAQGLLGRPGTDRLYQPTTSDRDGFRKNIVYVPDGKGGMTQSTEYVDQAMSGFEKATLGVLGGIATAGAASAFGGAAGAAGGSAGGGAVAAGGASYAIPTAAELAAGGFGTGGMAMTGAGGIGAAGSVAGAGAGAAGYGAAAGGGILGSIGSAISNVPTSTLLKGGAALVGGLAGGAGGGSGGDTSTATTQNQIDPRMGGILYGADGKSGLLNQIAGQANRPQSGGMAGFGSGMDDYLGQYGRGQFDTNMRAAQGLTGSNIGAPTMTGATSASPNQVGASFAGSPNNAPLSTMQAANASAPGNMQAAQINAPGQNGLGLQGAYNDMIYGAAGNNPYLTGGIQKGINQSNTAFQNMQTDSTRNLMENILPGIRSGAIANGQMGSSRQGIAEARALNDFSTQQGRAMSQFGQNNTDAAVAAQAGAYNTDRANSLNAMNNLSGQQYGVATNNAQFQQQANQTNYQGGLNVNLANQQAQNSASQSNASMANQNGQYNAGLQSQNNQFNASANNQMNQFNTQAGQQNNQFNANAANSANQNNGQWQYGTNGLNSNNQQAGIGLSNGLLNQAYGYGSAQDQYSINNLGKTAGLLQNFTGLNSTQTNSTPQYENKTGNIIAGATAGLGLLNAAQKFF